MKYINLVMLFILLGVALMGFVGSIFVAFNIGGDEIPSLVRGVFAFGGLALGFLTFVIIKEGIIKQIQEIQGKEVSW